MRLKKKTIGRLMLWGLLLFIVIAYGLLQFEIRKTLSIPYSQSIQDSKNKGAYLWSYKCPREVKISDSITLVFKEAFAEYYYRHKDYNSDEYDICKDEMHVICYFDREHCSKYARENYSKTWVIEDQFDSDVPLYKLFLYRDSVVAPDTVKLHIYNVNSISSKKRLIKIIDLIKNQNEVM